MNGVKSYTYVLLDWDGNLARTLDIWLAALRLPLERRGYNFTDEQIGANFSVFQERMTALGIGDVEAMITEADEMATRESPNVELYPDALLTLADLRRAGKRIALVTTSRHDQIDPLLEKYGMSELFDAVVCGDDVSQHKPNPEPINRALELLDGVKEEAVMVGDSASDIGSANNAGVDSILFFPPGHTRFYDIKKLELLHPTHIITDFRDVTRLASGHPDAS